MRATARGDHALAGGGHRQQPNGRACASGQGAERPVGAVVAAFADGVAGILADASAGDVAVRQSSGERADARRQLSAAISEAGAPSRDHEAGDYAHAEAFVRHAPARSGGGSLDLAEAARTSEPVDDRPVLAPAWRSFAEPTEPA